MKELKKEVIEFHKTRGQLKSEINGLKRDVAIELEKAVIKVLSNFGAKTGFVVSNINVKIQKDYFFGVEAPKYTFSQIDVELDIEDYL